MASRLCFEERVKIEALAKEGHNATEIALALDRDPTTVQREAARVRGPGVL